MQTANDTFALCHTLLDEVPQDRVRLLVAFDEDKAKHAPVVPRSRLGGVFGTNNNNNNNLNPLWYTDMFFRRAMRSRRVGERASAFGYSLVGALSLPCAFSFVPGLTNTLWHLRRDWYRRRSPGGTRENVVGSTLQAAAEELANIQKNANMYVSRELCSGQTLCELTVRAQTCANETQAWQYAHPDKRVRGSIVLTDLTRELRATASELQSAWGQNEKSNFSPLR